MTTISAQIAEGRHRLLRAGIGHDDATLEARLLAQFVLGWDTARLLSDGSEPPPPSFATSYDSLLSRREGREPLAYITGTKEFWNLRFDVSPDVLIPRPETEGLVEAALDLFPDTGGFLEIADVCTGSGCVAIALAVERPNARIVAADISRAALAMAHRNAAKHQVADRVTCVEGDLLAPLTGRFDAIVANPPYVPSRVRNGLQREVRDFEPSSALFGGADGLEVIRRLVHDSAAFLKSDGYLVFEFGDGQEDAVRQLISDSGALRMVAVKDDLQGIARIAILRLPGAEDEKLKPL